MGWRTGGSCYIVLNRAGVCGKRTKKPRARQVRRRSIYKSTDYRKPKVLEFYRTELERARVYGFIGRSPKRWWARAGARGGVSGTSLAGGGALLNSRMLLGGGA